MTCVTIGSQNQVIATEGKQRTVVSVLTLGLKNKVTHILGYLWSLFIPICVQMGPLMTVFLLKQGLSSGRVAG